MEWGTLFVWLIIIILVILGLVNDLYKIEHAVAVLVAVIVIWVLYQKS